MDAVFINSKGFGGNNATASILSPTVTAQMLEKKHGKSAMTKHQKLNEKVAESTHQYDVDTIAGKNELIYKFGLGVIEGEELELTETSISIPGHSQKISLEVENPYDDMI